jgi:hypothetical protein
MMKSLVKLRWINLVGSSLFAVYGLLIEAWPVMGINAVIALIDIWFLVRMLGGSEIFDLAPLKDVGEKYLKKFYLYYEQDIKETFPEVTFKDVTKANTYLLFRDMLPIGFFSIQEDDGEAFVLADYVVPAYRDFKTGRFLYRTKRMYFKERGIRRFIAERGEKAHAKYLQRNGFISVSENPSQMVNEL